MERSLLATRAGRFFFRVTARPRTLLLLGLLALGALSAYLPSLEREPHNKANIHPEHPARVATERLHDVFGVSEDDMIVVAIIRDEPGGVFRPETLGLVSWLTDRIARIEGVDPDQIISLATEKDIAGGEAGMVVRPFFETPPRTPEQAQRVRRDVMDFALYVDNLVSRDGRATLIVVELLDERFGADVYDAIVELTERAPRDDESLHVAGIAAFNSLLGDYIERDLRRLNPIAGAIIVCMLVVAYRTPRGAVIPLIAVVGAVIGALGLMSAFAVPFYTLTGTMTVILIAIGVCDGIHIMNQYYVEHARRPDASARELTVRAMIEMWRPVVVTSITTVAGFLAISAASNMPPVRWYGVFASAGVMSALLLCLFVVPAALCLLRPRGSRAYRPAPRGGAGADVFGRASAALGRAVYRRPGLVLGVAAGVALAAAVGAVRVKIDNSAVAYLNESEPLRQAELAINATLGGVTNLNVVIEAPEADDLYRPEYLRRIDALQRYLEGLPHVKSTTSLVDYVKQMHRAMNADEPAYYAIPDDADLVAQYFLAYSAGGSPTDFEEVVDYDFRTANVRVALDRGRATDSSVVALAAERFAAEQLEPAGLHVTLAGWANLYFHWSREIARSQLVGVPLAFFAVWAAAALSFRSAYGGALALIPTALAVLFVYAVMGVTGIWLNLANSILAALAVGVTVDFSVHTIDRLIELTRERGLVMEEAFAELFPSTGRALLFNFGAVVLGFGVLATSAIPPTRDFGVLVVVCVTTSFLASVTLLPALAVVLRPGFLARGQAAAPGRPEVGAPLAAARELGAGAGRSRGSRAPGS